MPDKTLAHETRSSAPGGRLLIVALTSLSRVARLVFLDFIRRPRNLRRMALLLPATLHKRPRAQLPALGPRLPYASRRRSRLGVPPVRIYRRNCLRCRFLQLDTASPVSLVLFLSAFSGFAHICVHLWRL